MWLLSQNLTWSKPKWENSGGTILTSHILATAVSGRIWKFFWNIFAIGQETCLRHKVKKCLQQTEDWAKLLVILDGVVDALLYIQQKDQDTLKSHALSPA